MKLVTPPQVRKGDTVHVISPSAGLFPFVKNRVNKAIQQLEALGLNVVIAENAHKNAGYVSSTIQDRVDDIHSAFLDTRCSLIIAAIGGNHSNQLISHLDYELIRKNPKVFIGYSDNTVLHTAFATQAQLQTYYGPCFLNQFGETPAILPYTLRHFTKAVMEAEPIGDIAPSVEYTDEILDWFTGADEKRARQFIPNSGFEFWRKGSASGWALPGAVPSLNHVLGTKYFPQPDGAILMLDIPEGHTMHEGTPVDEIDSWLTDMDNAGILAKIEGLIIGRPYKYNADMVEALKDIVLRITDKYNLPILYNADFGHTDPMITIPYGCEVSFDSHSHKLRLM